MNIDELRKQVPDETSCRMFFEKLIWSEGRICPHCQWSKSYHLKGGSCRAGLYECARCKRQFSVTTKTPMHSTKLPLWKWLLAIYYMINSSKGISSVFLSRLIGVKQSTAWKMGHGIRLMMDSWAMGMPKLNGVIEMDEKFFGGKPRPGYGTKYKISTKHSILVTVQRKGQVYSVPVEKVKTATIIPIIDAAIDTNADLMTDKSYAFHQPGKQFASHKSVYHMANEFARGDAHINTAESFGALLERVKVGVFHFMSTKHLDRYLSEMSFRWFHRDPKEVITKTGKKKTIWNPKPIMEQLASLMPFACGSQIRWQRTGALKEISVDSF